MKFNDFSKRCKSALLSAGIKDMKTLKEKFDEPYLMGLRGIGIVTFNEICQALKKYKQIRYSVDLIICQVCDGTISPCRWVGSDGDWLFGYLCSCSEKTRGKIGQDFAI